MIDYLIKNGFVIDGNGNQGQNISVAVENDRVAFIDNHDCEARYIIDAKGKYVFPGFIDIHTHSDHTLFIDGRGESFLHQGVAIDNFGNCGLSSAPLYGEAKLSKNIFCYIQSGKPIPWNSLSDYFAALRANENLYLNVSAMVGHAAIRSSVMGYENRPASDKEIELMCELLQQCFDEGAVGFSTGLEYFPGSIAEMEEIKALCRVTAKNDLLYATHIRNRDRFYNKGYSEAIETAKETGVRLQISHAIPKYGVPEGGTENILSMIEKARRDIDIQYDVIPFIWGPTSLTAVLPADILQLPTEEILKLLRQNSVRNQIRQREDCIWQLIKDNKWDLVKLQYCTHSCHLIGKTFEEIGEIKSMHPFDALIDIICDEGEDMHSGLINGRIRSAADADYFIRPEYCGIISDAMALAKDGPLAKIKWSDACYRWVPELFKQYVRNKNILSLEEAVRRITSLPASRLKLKKVGRILPGYYANLSIVDLDKFLEYQENEEYAKGIDYLFINGSPVIKNDKLAVKGKGKVLRPCQ